MIRVNVSLATATVTETETLTAGRVGLECGFAFSSEWSDLLKVAVFEGAETIEVALGKASVAVVPPECMATAGYNLRVGVYGLSPANAVVIPTVWAKAGKIKDSAAPDDESFAPATPELVAQILQASDDALTIARSVKQAADNGDFDGTDGISPSASVSKSGTTATITITDANGTTTASVSDGTDGDDGVSPTISSESITGGHRLTIVDAGGTTTVDVMDGEDGADVFWATKDTTTSAQIEAAYQAGKVCLCEYSSRVYRLNYRTSSTQHTFTMSRANTVYALECNNDAWSSTTYALAQSANIPAAASNAPADLGTAAKGSSSKYAREDHVHNKPTYTAADVGAIAAPASPSDGDFLVYDSGSGKWEAQAVPAANGEDF